jgi:hypothetical protein
MVNLYKKGVLNDTQTKALLTELEYKCEVYGNGCIKRGKIEEGKYYLGLTKTLL